MTPLTPSSQPSSYPSKPFLFYEAPEANQKPYLKVMKYYVGPNQNTDARYYLQEKSGYVGILPILKDKHGDDFVVLANQKRHSYKGTLNDTGQNIELVGGCVEPGETPEEAAAKELKEEFGLALSKGQQSKLEPLPFPMALVSKMPQWWHLFSITLPKETTQFKDDARELEIDEQLNGLKRIIVPVKGIMDWLKTKANQGVAINVGVFTAISHYLNQKHAKHAA